MWPTSRWATTFAICTTPPQPWDRAGAHFLQDQVRCRGLTTSLTAAICGTGEHQPTVNSAVNGGTEKVSIATVKRPKLEELNLSTGKKTRLYRLLHRYGPANGTMLLLPIDQGLEHGPRDFFECPDSANPGYQLLIAKEGGYSGIVFHVGIAEKYMHQYAGEVPLILKLNGKTDIPSDKAAFSGQTATVEDAVRLGADAIGYTLYIGSPAQAEDFIQFSQIRREADRYGIPVIVWAYPRGEAIETKGGRDSLYAVDYASRVASELGADVIKLNLPQVNHEKSKDSPKPYNTLRVTEEEAVRRVVHSAGKAFVIFAGGSRMSDDELLQKTRLVMNAGATGLVFGRNIWQRQLKEALKMSEKLRQVLLTS